MPSVSPRQHAFMEAIAHDPALARRAAVPVSVGQDFARADELRSAFADGGSVPSVLQNLPPELLAQLKQLGSSGSVDYGGVTYSPIGLTTNDEGGTSFTPQGYTAFTDGTALKPGAKGLEYGLDGSGGALPYEVSDGTSIKEMMQGVGKDALHVITPMIALYAMALGGEGLMSAFGGAGGAGAGLAEGAGSFMSPAEMDSMLATETAGGGGVLGAGGAAAGTAAGSVFNPAVDSQLASSELGLTAGDVTAGGIPSVGTAGNVPFDFGAASDVPSTFNAAKDSQLASDQLGLTAADTSSATIPSVGGPGNTPYSPSQWGGNWASGMSASDIAKVVSAVTSAVGGGSGTGTGSTPGGTTGGGGYQSHEIDPGYTLVTPGWRSGRPLYVPGKDAIPDGWFGAGYTSN
jgi:hypothetical protein